MLEAFFASTAGLGVDWVAPRYDPREFGYLFWSGTCETAFGSEHPARVTGTLQVPSWSEGGDVCLFLRGVQNYLDLGNW